MEKFKGIKDSKLFELWKNHDVDAESELISRYRDYSVGLANSLLEEFKRVTTAEKDDLVGVGLYCLFVALGKYKGTGSFYPYWKKIARNEMMVIIKDHSYSFIMKSNEYKRPYVTYNEEVNYAFEQNVANDSQFMYSELIDILKGNKINVTPEQLNMFLLYIDGYSIKEISLIFNVPYSTTKTRIARIKEKLKDILFNS